MARWLAILNLPEFPDRTTAEVYARRLVPLGTPLRVESVPSWEIAQEERQAARRERRRLEELDPD